MLPALVCAALAAAAYLLPVCLRMADLPVAVPLAFAGLAALFAWRAFARERGFGRGAVALLFTAGAAALPAWHFDLSRYEPAPSAPEAEKAAPSGEPIRKGAAALLIFFRGGF